MSIYESLNNMQQEAVYHTEGPLLILAGAGIWKDQSADPQDCIPYCRKGCESMEYPCNYLYQQGRSGNEGTCG